MTEIWLQGAQHSNYFQLSAVLPNMLHKPSKQEQEDHMRDELGFLPLQNSCYTAT